MFEHRDTWEIYRNTLNRFQRMEPVLICGGNAMSKAGAMEIAEKRYDLIEDKQNLIVLVTTKHGVKYNYGPEQKPSRKQTIYTGKNKWRRQDWS